MQSKTLSLERWRFSATVLVPAVLALVLTGLAVGGFVLWSTASLDNRALERQTRMVSTVLDRARAEIVHDLESVANWDDAVISATAPVDTAWLDDNIGEWLHSYFGHSRSAVLSPSGQPIFVARDGQPAAPELYDDMKTALTPLLARLKRTIAAGGVSDYRAGRRDTPPAESAFATIGGEPAIVAAMPLMSDTGRVAPDRGHEHVLVAAQALDDSFAQLLSRELLFEDAAFVFRPTGRPHQAAFPIVSGDGRLIAFFEWTRERPGQLMLTQTGPALVAGFVISAIIVVLLMAKLRRSASAIEMGRRHAEHQAAHDRLTGLPNRAAFDRSLARMVAERSKTGGHLNLYMLDLDRFKQVNDTHGHQAGDQLICSVGDRLRAVAGPEVLIARLGGDEFALLEVTNSPGRDPMILSRQIIDAISQPFELRQFRAFVGASIGVVVADAGATDEPRDLIRKADIALYEAKAAGRNRAVVYEEHMNELLQLQHTIEGELREALIRREQLSVAFQPLVDQQSRRVIGAEALVRWSHPKYGNISPARFIPVAENTGLIVALGEFVLRKACELGATVPGRTIAVNISTVQLRNPSFATQVFDVLHETGMRADDLELEITESILLDDELTSTKNLMTLRSAGIHVALDDFGTGYSSLSYLKRYPVDRIKIDRSFVSQLAPGHVSVAITQALVTLAHAMKIHVTAEGVETEAQADILGTLGCNTLQGFLFCGAVDRDTITQIFAEPGNMPARRRVNVA